MPSREQLIHRRIIHVVIMIATGIFVYQYSQWDDGLWIPISILAIVGPFSPGLTINKARQRVLGTLCGLLISLILWLFLHYNPNALVFIALIMIYGVAFTALQEYTYFILLVSIMLCVNFDYMNLFVNNEISFIANRGLCVLVGVTICQFYEYFIFSRYYDNALTLVEARRLDELVIKSWETIRQMSESDLVTISKLNKTVEPLILELKRLEELKESCLHGYSEQSKTIDLIERYESKLTSLYDWLNSMGFSLLCRQKRVLQDKKSLPVDNLCN